MDDDYPWVNDDVGGVRVVMRAYIFQSQCLTLRTEWNRFFQDMQRLVFRSCAAVAGNAARAGPVQWIHVAAVLIARKAAVVACMPEDDISGRSAAGRKR